MEIKGIISLALIASMFLIGFSLYPKMPESMAIHWNARGEPDGWGSRFMGLLLFPIVTFGAFILLQIIPKIAVFKENIQQFMGYYKSFILVFVLFMFGMYAITTMINLGYKIEINYFVIPAVAGLLYFVGHMLQHAKRNFFIGIRTPWTLANDEVWDKTHKLGSKTFRASAVIILFALVSPQKYFVWIILVPLLLNVVFLFIYSYFLYQKINKREL